jgi:spore coat protein U-like protein
MASAAERLPYVLYQEAGRITEIAASVANTNFVTTTLGNGSTQTYTVYGRIVGAESSASPPGSYSDTVIITVAF